MHLFLCGTFREEPELWAAHDLRVWGIQCMMSYRLLAENCGACLGERIALPAYPRPPFFLYSLEDILPLISPSEIYTDTHIHNQNSLLPFMQPTTLIHTSLYKTSYCCSPNPSMPPPPTAQLQLPVSFRCHRLNISNSLRVSCLNCLCVCLWCNIS